MMHLRGQEAARLRAGLTGRHRVSVLLARAAGGDSAPPYGASLGAHVSPGQRASRRGIAPGEKVVVEHTHGGTLSTRGSYRVTGEAANRNIDDRTTVTS